MCDPVSIGYAVVTAASTALQIKQQNELADAQTKAANQSAAADYVTLQAQQQQADQQANLEITERQKQAMRERGRLITAMGEGNISGNSPLREIANSFQDEAYDVGILKTNKENARYGITTQMQSVKATEQSRLNEATSHKSSALSTALQIGASAYSGYVGGTNLRRQINLKGGT